MCLSNTGWLATPILARRRRPASRELGHITPAIRRDIKRLAVTSTATRTPGPPQQGLDGLQGLRLTGTSSSVSQSSAYEIANGFLATAIDAGDPLSIGGNWTQAEFNIFGYSGGSNITFNQGTSIVVRIEGYGGDATPQCLSGGFTGESNNLNPILPCAQYNGGILGPGVQFTQDFFLPIPGCLYPNGVATCVAIPGSTFTDATFTAACPAGGTTIRSMNGGVWQALPLHCSDGSLPGHCNPAATVPNQAVLSTQRYGVSTSGAPVGSSQTVEVCDNASNCSRFALGIPNCPSPVAPGNSLKLSDGNNPIEVTAGGSIDANLVLDGPWVSLDHGAGATGSTFAGAGLPKGMIVTLAPGVSGAPHTYGLMDVNVEAPPDAPPGDYSFQVKATDLASNVTLNTTVPVRILACKPTKVCSTIGLHMCGAVSNGCGGTADCGACATGVCSNGFCCPDGSFFNAAINSCQPNSCPAGKVYCPALGDCETDQVCEAANQPVCRKIGTRIVCQ